MVTTNRNRNRSRSRHRTFALSRIIANGIILLFLLVGLLLHIRLAVGTVKISSNDEHKRHTIYRTIPNGNGDDNQTVHRVFPAAKIESYNHPDNLPPILGILSFSRSIGISFATSFSSAANADHNANSDRTTQDATAASAGARARVTNETVTTSTTRSRTLQSHGSHRHRNLNHNPDTKTIDDILNPAMARFQNSLRRYPDFRDDYTVNPKNLPLVQIDKTFLIALDSSDTNLYHGVPEDYEIHVSVKNTRTDYDGANGDDMFNNGRNYSDGGHHKNISNIDRNNAKDDDRFVIISIKASTVFGVLRALETLGQLLEFGWMEKKSGSKNNNGDGGDGDGDGDSSGVFVIRDLPLHISDEPAFPYRGLMIDTARHYLPMDLILDNLDAMAMNKMNVLHWHIADSQSFPYAPEDLPELAYKGAYHPRRIYTPQDVRTLLQEAYLRGIRVIPEIDMPGHTNAIAASHPEVMSHCPDPSEPMNPTVPETYDFIREIYRDLDAVFPDEMVHLGGDEVQLSEACWLKDPSIAKWMRDHGMGNKTVDLYEYFETNLLQTIASFGKTPIVWQEVFDLNLTIPKDAIIDVWKGFDKYSIQNATHQGHRVILSGCWYLDHLDQSWQKFYACDPLNFTSPHKELMIGGHASMWGEHVDASNFVSRVWPRASSVAERLWHGTIPTPTGHNDSVKADVETNVNANAAAASVAERIHAFRCRMVLMGFDAGPTGPGVCPTEVAHARRDDRYRCNHVGDHERA